MTKTIHFNNCGAAPTLPGALERIAAHLARESEIGAYRAADEAADELSAGYRALEALIGAEQGTIALTQSATQSWLQAFHGIRWQQGDEVLTHAGEYRANVIALEDAKARYGIEVRLVPSHESGAIDLEKLESMITGRTRLIALTWLPSNDGLVNPAEQVGHIAAAHGIDYLLDACQAVGQMPVDVARLHCTYLAATGRKFLCGPRGTGFLYVAPQAQGHLRPPMIDQQALMFPDDARRFELFERSIALALGLGEAARHAVDSDIAAGFAHISRLSARIRASIDDRPGWACLDRGEVKSGIITFRSDARDAAQVAEHLWQAGIVTSVSGQAYAPYDGAMPAAYNRLGLHSFNTDQEVDVFLAALDSLA